MGRLLGLLMTGIVVAALAVLFLRPATLHVDRRGPEGAPGVTPGTALLSASVGAAVQKTFTAPSRYMVRGRIRRPAGARPALGGNPPGARRLASAAPPYLKLPNPLPHRVLDVPIMMYHHVSSVAPATDLNYGLTVTGTAFVAQLAYLRDRGYHTILLRQLFGALYKHQPLPTRPIVLTFDDGYRDNATDALPILRRFHDHGEFNIITGYVGLTVGVNSYMTWQQLHALVAAGMEIGSHTVDHQDLGLLTVDHARFELRDSRNILQRTLHVHVQFLAYPSGEPFVHGTPDAQQRILALMPQYGYVGALLDGPLTTSRQDARAPFQLQRIRVAGGETLDEFAASLQQ